jgi:hypothetical protein
MNELQAREILGCSPTASFKEIKAAYRRMIVLVHPDKAGQDAISQDRAKEASSRLNHAWEYLENREKQGLLGKQDSESTYESTSSRGRATYPHECDICGYAPATKISAPIITSFVYFLRRGKYELNTCKACGITMSRMALRETLIKGWWGLGLFFVPHAIFRYFMNMNALKKIDEPTYRDPEVITLSQYPFRVPTSPFRQPAPLVATAIALTILGAIISSDPSGTGTNSTPSMYFGEVNSCYEEVSSADGQKIKMSECSSSSATLKSVAVVDADYLCPASTLYTTVANLPDGTTKTACLERLIRQ